VAVTSFPIQERFDRHPDKRNGGAAIVGDVAVSRVFCSPTRPRAISRAGSQDAQVVVDEFGDALDRVRARPLELPRAR